LNGKRFRRSAGTKDWQRALRKIAAWENPEAASLKPVAEAIAAFKVHCRELSPSSRRKYRNVFRQLENFCKKRGIDTLAELTVEVLDEYRAQRDISPLTATKELQTLRQFCGFCLERGWLRKNLAKGIRPPKNANPRPIEPYTAEEVAAIIAACSEIGFHSYERLRARAMILLMRYAALRISDVVTLAKSRIKDGLVHLHTQKTGGTVLLPLPAELQQALDSLPLPNGAKPGCPYFFWNGLSLKRHLVTKAHRTLYAVFEKAEVENARSHRFRHTLATEILAKGGTEQDVADVLGISPAIVRKHYAKWTQARQERVIGIMKAVHGQVYQLPDKPAEGKETVQ
jgi:site-specific recombinase XerD